MEDVNVKHKVGFINIMKRMCSKMSHAFKNLVSEEDFEIADPNMEDPEVIGFFKNVEKIDSMYQQDNRSSRSNLQQRIDTLSRNVKTITVGKNTKKALKKDDRDRSDE